MKRLASHSSSVKRLFLAVLALAALHGAASAQSTDVTMPPEAAQLELRRAESIDEYERIQGEIGLSEQRRMALEAEIAEVRKDHAALSAALVQAAKSERKLQGDISEIAAKLEGLRSRQTPLRASLVERRDLLAEILAGLQRMGLNPPPAILVRPDDALASVRSAILLGSLVPELRRETDQLVNDLEELAQLAAAIETERTRLFRSVSEQAAEKHRLNGLLRQKRLLRERSQEALETEQARMAELAEKAGSMEDLISSLESDIAQARAAAEEARLAALAREEEPQVAALPEHTAPLIDQPPFQTLKAGLSLPVSGHIERRFGQADSTGSRLMGDTLRTHSGAIVTAPAGGSVLYAGPFRSYGQLLILNVGEGYHVVLAGLGSIGVGLGQSVLAGEPIGTMGQARVASATAFDEMSSEPELYVEFRKDGKPVDPSPWWAERSSGRTGNDT